MNIDQFQQLSIREQGIRIITEGKFLKSRLEDQFIVNLYALDDLLVEVYYDKPSNTLTRVTIVRDDEQLNTYLDD